MKKIKLPDGRYILTDDEDYPLLNRHKWHLDSSGYAQVRVGYKSIGMVALIHPKTISAGYRMSVDHINRNKLDNRKKNLRFVSCQNNSRNKRKATNKKSCDFKGVYPTPSEKWYAQIKANGKSLRLGTFKDKRDAALAYDAKAKELFGEYACTNKDLGLIK
jgi:hypothetical protein